MIPRIDLFKSSLTYSGANLWNSLPESLKKKKKPYLHHPSNADFWTRLNAKVCSNLWYFVGNGHWHFWLFLHLIRLYKLYYSTYQLFNSFSRLTHSVFLVILLLIYSAFINLFYPLTFTPHPSLFSLFSFIVHLCTYLLIWIYLISSSWGFCCCCCFFVCLFVLLFFTALMYNFVSPFTC